MIPSKSHDLKVLFCWQSSLEWHCIASHCLSLPRIAYYCLALPPLLLPGCVNCRVCNDDGQTQKIRVPGKNSNYHSLSFLPKHNYYECCCCMSGLRFTAERKQVECREVEILTKMIGSENEQNDENESKSKNIRV